MVAAGLGDVPGLSRGGSLCAVVSAPALIGQGVRSQSWCADLRRGRWSNPTDSEQVVPQYLRYPAQNPTEGAPIRALGSVQRALVTRAGGAAAGWLRNSGISGAGTMGQRAETVGS